MDVSTCASILLSVLQRKFTPALSARCRGDQRCRECKEEDCSSTAHYTPSPGQTVSSTSGALDSIRAEIRFYKYVSQDLPPVTDPHWKEAAMLYLKRATPLYVAENVVVLCNNRCAEAVPNVVDSELHDVSPRRSTQPPQASADGS